jgi:hypothetical protein
MATSEKYPTQPDLAQRLSAMEERLQRLERGSNPTQSVFYDASGNVLFRAGTHPTTGRRGFTVGRSLGAPAIEVTKLDDSEPSERVVLRDRVGNVLFSDSSAAESGAGAPFLDIFSRTAGSDQVTGNYLSWQTVCEAHFRKYNAVLEWSFYYQMSDLTTNAHVRFLDQDGNYIATPTGEQVEMELAGVTGATLTTSGPLSIGPALPVGSPLRIYMQAIRSAGAGTITWYNQGLRGIPGY